MVGPTIVRYFWTPRVATAYALRLDASGRHPAGILADLIAVALCEAGADCAAVVQIDLDLSQCALVDVICEGA